MVIDTKIKSEIRKSNERIAYRSKRSLEQVTAWSLSARLRTLLQSCLVFQGCFTLGRAYELSTVVLTVLEMENALDDLENHGILEYAPHSSEWCVTEFGKAVASFIE